MQLSKILIGMVIMTMIVSGLIIFYAGGAVTYEKTDYDAAALQTLAGAQDDLNSVVSNTETNLTNIKGTVDQSDASEVLLTGAFKTAILTGKSVPIIVNSTQTAVNTLPVTNNYANNIIGGLALIVLIVFIIAIIMNIATKSPRT